MLNPCSALKSAACTPDENIPDEPKENDGASCQAMKLIIRTMKGRLSSPIQLFSLPMRPGEDITRRSPWVQKDRCQTGHTEPCNLQSLSLRCRITSDIAQSIVHIALMPASFESDIRSGWPKWPTTYCTSVRSTSISPKTIISPSGRSARQ